MSGLFEDDIRGRKGKDGKRPRGRDRSIPMRVGELHRNTRGHPEVVIKISSYAKDRGRASAHADYVTRRDKEGGDLPVEMADGSVLTEPEEISEVLDDWFARQETRKDARKTVNMVLSTPTGSDPAKLKVAVREFAKDFFGNHDYMFVIHTDTKNPHAHLTVKTRDFDGKQLRLGKPQLKQMRDLYAAKLREQGVEVNSAYRSDRGKSQRPKSQGQYHLDKRGESRNTASLKRTARDLDEGMPKDEPWRDAMLKRHKQTRAEYLGSAKFLRSEFGGEFEQQSKDLEDFANNLPAPKTRLDIEIQRQQQQQNANRKQQDRGPGGVTR